MSKTLKNLKELPLEKQNTFWETIFGFISYDQALERFSIEESTLDKQLDRVVIFLKHLEDYRTLIDTQKIHTFQQVEENQLRVFTKNDFQQLWPPLNLFLDAKLFPENKSTKQNILETKSKQEKEFQKIQFYYLNLLMEIDYVFFIYVQMCYSSLSGSIFYFFRKYINSVAHSTIDDFRHFNWFYPLEKIQNGDSSKINQIYKSLDKNYIDQSWKKETEILNLIDFNEEIGSHIMQLWLKDFKKQIKNSIAKQAHQKSQYIQHINHAPMTHFFWNCSQKNDRSFSLLLEDEFSYNQERSENLLGMLAKLEN